MMQLVLMGTQGFWKETIDDLNDVYRWFLSPHMGVVPTGEAWEAGLTKYWTSICQAIKCKGMDSKTLIAKYPWFKLCLIANNLQQAWPWLLLSASFVNELVDLVAPMGPGIKEVISWCSKFLFLDSH